MRDEEHADSGPTVEELVERGRSGDQAALGELVERYHGAAYRAALAVARDDELAQDAVQNGFLNAFRALDRFREEASFRTWLLTITANEARSLLRKRGRRRETALEDVGEIGAGGSDPSERAMVAAEAARAREMLGRLPEKQRLSVSLRIDEGLSFREIGEIIGSSEGAARVNYFHGIRKLRDWME